MFVNDKPLGAKRNSFIKRIYFVLLRQKKIYLDKTTHISKSADLKNLFGGYIKIGKNSEIHEFSILHTYGGFIEIGDDCSINPFCVIYGHGGLKIGNKVRIAAQTIIIPANHSFDNIDTPIMYQAEKRKGIVIGNDVWLGANVKILDGVKIGDGSVVGSGSVVTKSIPPYSVAVGNPAKIIKNRNNDF